jgi:hypothetical protein
MLSDVNFVLVSILAAISALIVSYGISKKLSFLGFIIWYGISFLVVWGMFMLFEFIF